MNPNECCTPTMPLSKVTGPIKTVIVRTSPGGARNYVRYVLPDGGFTCTEQLTAALVFPDMGSAVEAVLRRKAAYTGYGFGVYSLIPVRVNPPVPTPPPIESLF